mgnify:CR=1 FL=1
MKWKRINESYDEDSPSSSKMTLDQFLKLKGKKATDLTSKEIEEYKMLAGGEKKKKPKDKKIFKVGDVVTCLSTKEGKLPPDAIDFLLTYKKFHVLDVNDKLNIDIGHISTSGNPFYFAPNRFELIDGIAPVRKAGEESETDQEGDRDLGDKIIKDLEEFKKKEKKKEDKYKIDPEGRKYYVGKIDSCGNAIYVKPKKKIEENDWGSCGGYYSGAHNPC